ncbi:hypothetical protein L195_g057289, partial [Trifolium pratense]
MILLILWLMMWATINSEDVYFLLTSYHIYNRRWKVQLENVDNAGQPMPGEEQEDIEEEEKDNGKKVLMEFPKTEKRQRLLGDGYLGSAAVFREEEE